MFYALILVGGHVAVWGAGVGFDASEGLGSVLAQFGVTAPLSVAQRAAGFVIAGLPLGFVVVSLVRLAQAFLEFAAGRIFTGRAVTLLRGAAAAALIAAVLNLLQAPIMSLVLTAANPAGEHQLVLSLSSGGIENFIQAGLLYVIAWVFAQGRRMSDELESII